MTRQLDWIGCHKSIDDPAVVAVENRLGVTLPQDFVAIAKQCHGGHPRQNRFVYENPDMGPVATCFAELLSFDLTYKDNIVETRDYLSNWLPSGIIPFAADGGGDYICFDYRRSETSPTVLYWAHEWDLADSLIPLCATFSDFLDLLEEP